MLQSDYIGEYKGDQFLLFDYNNSIDMHFTAQKQIVVVKEMNRVLLKKVQCLLSNV